MTSVCIDLGYVRTPLQDVAVKRLVEPEEVGSLVGWLTGPDASMVSGASWAKDGSWSTR